MFDELESPRFLKFPWWFSFYSPWVLCLVTIGFALLAYATNPSERSCRRFLSQVSFLGQLSQLSPTHASSPTRRNGLCQFSPRARSALTIGKVSLNPRIPPYIRHNLYICTLILIENCCSRSNSPNSEEDDLSDDNFNQVRWCLGIFGTWLTLDRQKFTSWARAFLMDNVRMAEWKAWLIPGPWRTIPSFNHGDESVPDLISKPLKKKKKLTQAHKSHLIVSSSSLRARASSDVRSLEKSDDCRSELSEISLLSSEGTKSNRSESISTKERKRTLSRLNALTTSAIVLGENRACLLPPVQLQSHSEEVSLTGDKSASPRITDQEVRNRPKLSPDAQARARDLMLVISESGPRSLEETIDGSLRSHELLQEQTRADKDPHTTCSDFDNEGSTSNSAATIKEIKHSEECKLSNSDENVEELPQSQPEPVEKPPCSQKAFEALKPDHATVVTCPKPQAEKKGPENHKPEIPDRKPELKMLAVGHVRSEAPREDIIQDKAPARKSHSSQKRSTNRKRAKCHSQTGKLGPSTARTTEKEKKSHNPVDTISEIEEKPSCLVAASDAEERKISSAGLVETVSAQNSILTESQTVLTIRESSNSPLSTSVPESQLSDSARISVDPWITDTCAEETLQNDIRETFTSLPNLETNVLKSMLGSPDMAWKRLPFSSSLQSVISKDLTGQGADACSYLGQMSVQFEHSGFQSLSSYSVIGPHSIQTCPLPYSPVTYESSPQLQNTAKYIMGFPDEKNLTLHSSPVLSPLEIWPSSQPEFLDGLNSPPRPGSSASLSQRSIPLCPVSNAPYPVPIQTLPPQAQWVDEVSEAASPTLSPSPMLTRLGSQHNVNTFSSELSPFVEPSGLPQRAQTQLDTALPFDGLDHMNLISANCVSGKRRDRRSIEWRSGPMKKGHKTSQSLGGSSRGFKALDSIFDNLSGASLSASYGYGKTPNPLKHSTSGMKLNPSAKAFEFGSSHIPSNLESGSGDRPTSREFQSTNSSTLMLTSLKNSPALGRLVETNGSDLMRDDQVKIPSCVSVSGGGLEEKSQIFPMSDPAPVEPQIKLNPQTFAATGEFFNSKAKNQLSGKQEALKEVGNQIWAPQKARNSLEIDMKKIEKLNSELNLSAHKEYKSKRCSQEFNLLGDLLSPGEALPPACTRTACAGLFGPIGGGSCSQK